MAKKETEPVSSEVVRQDDVAPDNAINGKKSFFTPKRVETIVAILLGVTTLLSAWASWIGHLHGGLQSINFTESNNAASHGTAVYSLSMQMFLADMISWNTVKDYYYDLDLAKLDGDQAKIDLIEEKIKKFEMENASDILIEGVKWMKENGEDNPFNMPDITEKYFATAQETIEKSQHLLDEGKRDNTKGDSYMLVTVIYSLTLFLLGIVGTFKSMPNRIAVLLIAVVCLVFAFIYMCTIPLPTGFSKMNFFDFNG